MSANIRKSTTIRLAGESGEGVVSAGVILTDALIEQGFSILTFQSFPAEIKGGHCWYQVRGSATRIETPGDKVDILIAFNQEGFDTHLDDLRSGALILYDEAQVKPQEVSGVECVSFPMTRLAQEEVGSPRSKNIVASSIIARLLGLPKSDVIDGVTNKFRHKGEKIVAMNVKAVEVAYDFPLPDVDMDFALNKAEDMGDQSGIFAMTGNDAIVLGSLIAGCNFFAGYPITPASTILEGLTRELPAWGGATVQAEDEMSALTHCLGASFTGAKAMTATSGPGLALMIELLGHASTVELPVVIVDAQRGGPSTGLPTKYEQSDLFLAAFAGNGDAPRVVLAPSNVRECFDLAVKAFNIAEEYQVPVILMPDNALSTRLDRITLPDVNAIEVVDRLKAKPDPEETRFKRYALTPNGISPFPVPGTPGGMYVCEGLEHDETGKPNYSGKMHTNMNMKRFAKLDQLLEKETGYYDVGPDDPEVLVISWGATGGAVREAVDRLTDDGLNVGGCVVTMPWPLPHGVRQRARKARKVLVVESNFQGQLAHIIAAHVPVAPVKLTETNARLIPVEDIVTKAMELLEMKEVTA